MSTWLGHIYITVDDGPYRCLDTTGQPIIVNKLLPGPQRIRIELVDPTHGALDRQVVSFTVPVPRTPAEPGVPGALEFGRDRSGQEIRTARARSAQRV